MKKILIIVMVLVIMLLPAAAHAADFGSFSGDTDFGGGWSSSSFDTDYSGGMSFFPVFLGGSTGGGNSGIMWIIIAVILIAIIILRSKAKGKSGSAKPAGAQETPQAMLRPMMEYTSLDPNFDESELCEKLSNIYVKMQNAWTDKDIAPVRPYFTDAIYQQMDRQLEMMRRTGRTNYVERIAVLGVTLRGFMQKNGEDHIIAELRTRIVDYTMDDKTGKLITGSQTAEKFMTYEWDISRASGFITQEHGNMQRVSCPGCGAPLDINATAKCPYCDSIVTLEEHDWAISAIRGISQRTQ